MLETRVSAYTDKLSVVAGETLNVMASAEGATSVSATLVRLIHGDENPAGPGFLEQIVPSPIAREWPVQKQYIQKGNFLRVSDTRAMLALPGSFTVHTYIYPTLPDGGRQVIVGRWSIDTATGYGMGIGETGCLEFWIGNGIAASGLGANRPLTVNTWYFVAASFNAADGTATLYQEAVINRYNSLHSKIVAREYDSHISKTLGELIQRADREFIIGGTQNRIESRGEFVDCCYNGKIDRCGVNVAALSRRELDLIRDGAPPPQDSLLVYWDTSAGYSDRGIGDLVRDVGPHGLHAKGVNRPVRGQTGWNWKGRNDCFRLASDEYGGIEFHADALTDCCWKTTLSLVIPADLKSGIYAVKLRAGKGSGLAEEYTPFVVRTSAPPKPICLIIPSASYLAYANTQTPFDGDHAESIAGIPQVFQDVDIQTYGNDVEFGLSTYDRYRNGVGVCYSSYRRPIINMRPKHRFPGGDCPWQFPADLSIVAWLEHMKYEYDVLTDEDIHRDGVAALAPYRVAINGTHCEYYSEPMMDATEDYLHQGGRLLYLSGNGYYWVVGFRENEPWIMEVRRLDSGSRAWQARAGEYYLASTGERGGIWRSRNRAPQKLVGTGFTSEGMDYSVPYRRLPDSYHQALSWIFEGVQGEIFGDFGLIGGGAAGVEVDRYDLTLGTPPNAHIVATSEPFSDNYPLVQEDIAFTVPGLGGTQNPLVRADMVYYTTANHGAVFSTSSIAWGSALPCNGFDNSVSRIMRNVIDMFLNPGPLPAGT